ncbi:phosphonate metabolism transcriptional regulator PhnF [Neogemmobacter tilapiae]|uniref:Phosphonate metabolism transcriptional regulator PhnF n=1 Tax=Neogemmobacter tilapiae TaxID=875041 RepID=A0A918WK32_9RHOB|nr:phosphonate metabolism transcriptional regulator PhnF [Gemmobacter tilapiae]GHC53648.1 phosphonate metabolism transcriptional regulator PhnF [Gemmobacter tilapiae]
MSRSPLWRSIADSLRGEILEGLYPPTAKLPTEAELANRFGVNRHTIRRALADLAGTGLVHARRGAGVFITAKPAEYAIGRRVRFHQNLAAQGRLPSRRFTRMETRPAKDKEAKALGLGQGAAVHVVEGVSLADGVPLASFRSVFPADHLPGLLAHLQMTGSITAALGAEGVADYTRAETRVTAKLADALLANALQLVQGAPILRTVAINIGSDGRTVEYGTTWFAGDRISLMVTEPLLSAGTWVK